MDYTNILLGGALGWAANVGMKVGFANAPTAMMAAVQANPVSLVFPLAGAYVGAVYLSSFYSLPTWAWAAVGSNLSVMFVAPMLDRAMAL